MVKTIRILTLLLLVSLQAKSQFVVSNYYPQSATYQDTVFIVGNGFGTDETDIFVKLGKGNAEVVSVQDQLIKVLVPGTATYGTVTITQNSTHLTHFSNTPFLPIYQSESFDFSHISVTENIANEETGLYDLCNCDFDLDGDQDIATVNNSDAARLTSVNVFSNTTTAPSSVSFTKVPGTYFNISQPARNVSCGDLDGDGKPELIVTQGGNVAENIYIFKNTSSLDPAIINFSSPIILSTSNGGQTNGTRRMALHDLDGDLLPEIIVTNQTAQQVIIFENESSGGTINFPADKRQYLSVPANTLGLAVSDIDGDGKVDVIVSENLGGDFYVLRNQSTEDNISFAAPLTFNLSGQLVNLAIGDIDGNGKLDIALTDFEDGAILLLLNQSDPSNIAFASPIRMNAAIQPWGIVLSDISGNGKADIIVSTIAASDKVLILKNNSTVGNSNFELIPAGATERYRNLAIADINGDAKPDIITTKEDAFGNFFVTYIQNNSCIKAEIFPSNTPAICEASPVLLSAPIAKNVSYQWAIDGSVIAGATQANYLAGTAGSYTVEIVDNDIGCTSTSEAVNVVEDTGTIPEVPDILAPSTICEGETLNLSAGDNDALSYYWTGPSGFESTEKNPSIASVSAINSGVYQLEVRQGLCKSAVKSVFIEVITSDEVLLQTDGSPLLCPGDSLGISFDATGYTDIQWLKDSQPIDGATAATYTATEAGTYQLTASNSGSCTISSNSISVSFLPLQAVISTESSSVCEMSAISFSSQSTVPEQTDISYTWDFGDGNTSAEPNPVHQYTTSGIYTVSLGLSVNEGACTTSASQTVTINPRPEVELISSSDIICPGDSVSLEAMGSFSEIQWEDGSQRPQRWISQEGTYTATVFNENGCDSTYSIELFQQIPPQVFIDADGSTTIALGDSIQLFATGADFYEWSPGTALSDSTIANPYAKPLRTTTFMLTAFNEGGCPSTAEITINVDIDQIPVDALDIFSPNGDGIEDTWVINNFVDFPECYFIVFDINGREVYRSSATYLNDWGGTTLSGSPLPEGSYYYVVRCGDRQNKASGSVTILR